MPPDRGGTEGGVPGPLDEEVVVVVDLNPDGCCCADETLGVEIEAALDFVSQGFSGVDVAIARTYTCDWAGSVLVRVHKLDILEPSFKIRTYWVCVRRAGEKMATQTEVVTVTGNEEQAGPDTVQEQSENVEKKQNWVRRRFKKNKDEKNEDEKKSRKPPGEKTPARKHST